jgi:hypothetical protein
MTDAPEIPDAMLDQILGDPEAVSVLQQIAERAGVSTPVAEMSSAEQRQLVSLMFSIMQRSQAGEGGAPGQGEAVPDEIVEQIFTDPRADGVLREIMESNELTGEPADLPIEAKRAIVNLLVEQGIVSFG